MQPQRPPAPRQSKPPAHPSKVDGGLRDLPPGGPIKPKQQLYENPGPTPNLRGVEPNTAMHKGDPNPEQHGTHGRIGDHNPGPNSDVHDRQGRGTPQAKGRTSEVSKKQGPPMPDPMGVRK